MDSRLNQALSLLWYDADPKRDLADKVARAAARYREKFGVPATVCRINPTLLDREIRLDGVRVVPAQNVLLHHFLVGVETQSGNGFYQCKACAYESFEPAPACPMCGYRGET